MIDLDSKGVRAASTREHQKPIPRPAWFVLPPRGPAHVVEPAPALRVPFSSKPLRKLHKRGAGKFSAGSTPFRLRTGYQPFQPGSIL